MDEPIVVESSMSQEDCIHFSWFSALKKGRHIKPVIYIMIAAIAVALFSLTMLVIADGFEYTMETDGVFLVAAVLILPAYFLLLGITFRLSYKRMANLLVLSARYEFTADGLVVEGRSQSVASRAEYRYGLFYRVFEVKNALYLFVNKMQGFILPYRAMDNETRERLARLLKEKMGGKYVACHK
jgi:hypothetical protein